MATNLSEGVLLHWFETPVTGFNVVDHGRAVGFDPGIWAATHPRLQPGAAASYFELARSGEFGPWWLDACGGEQPGIRRFRLQLPPSVWERPWEGIVGGLDRFRWSQVSLIRQIEGDTSSLQLSKLSEPLTILCLQGAANGTGLDTLDLDAEFEALEAAYRDLDFSVRDAIAPPLAHGAVFSQLESLLLRHRPGVLWFSGHARSDPPGLLMVDGQWVSPQELKEAFGRISAQGGRTPLYVVLWACETGSARSFAAPTATPPFIDALNGEGVAAMLVSQAPLSDVSARIVAVEVFIALASGRPLDHGVARARGRLMQAAGDQLTETLDWISPVVWYKGIPPPSVAWIDCRQEHAQRQQLAQKLLPASLRDLLVYADTCEANPWLDVPRLWVVSSSPRSAASMAKWAERVIARQKQTLRTVLWFDFSSVPRGQAAHLVLQDWAKIVSRKVEHDDDKNQTIRTLAEQLAKDYVNGWLALCSSDLFIIAMIEPPDRHANWVWDGLRNGSKAQAIVLANDYPDQGALENWRIDSLVERPQSPEGEESPLLTALALLGCPAAKQDIESAIGASLDLLIGRGLVAETRAGCVAPASVAEAVAKTLSSEARAEGHRLAYSFLDGQVAHRKISEGSREDILLARFHHAQLCGWSDALRADGVNLLRLYMRENRSAAFIELLEGIVQEQRFLPVDVKIGAVWSYLALGKASEADAWLHLLEPDDLEPVDAAAWYTSRAEIEKSSGRQGSKAAARTYLDKALEALEGEHSEQAERQRLRCRHDIARLVHFFERKPAEALVLYKEMADAWERLPFSALDRAITIRNMAEALMHTSEYDEAERCVSQARGLIPDWTQHIVVSELEYLAARISTRLGLRDSSISERLGTCREKALVTNHLMMAAIVEARIFWRADPGQESADLFEDTQWASYARKLMIFDRHAWAARVLINGRLRAARRLAGRGENPAAHTELTDARRLLAANPAFDEGDDRRRIVVCYAGLALCTANRSKWCDELKSRYPWSDEWLADNASNDLNVAFTLAG